MMKTINIHGAQPMVQVTAVGVPEPTPVRRLGFLAGQFKIPDDFDTMAQEQIEDLFQGKS